MKLKIKKLARTFGGSCTDEELIKLLGLSSTTYYKYKKELKAEMKRIIDIKGKIDDAKIKW